MKQRYFHPEIERAPLPQLISHLDEKLASTDVFVRAAKSPLYQERWINAGINPSGIKSVEDVQRLPFTNSSDLRIAQENHHPDEFICGKERPRFWISTSGSTGVPKWVPVGGQDRFNNIQIGYRLLYFPDKRPPTSDDVAFGVSAPAPFISDTGAWSGFINDLLGYGPQDFGDFERVIFSYQEGIEGTAMAIKRKVSIFMAFPSLVMRIAEGLSESAPKLAQQQLKEKFNLVNLLVFIITRVKKIRARNIVKVHTGVFAGEPLEPYRKALLDAWDLRYTYNMYTSTEFQISFAECSEQNGMHVWLDACLPEIIPQHELDREDEQDGYIPKAIPLWETQPGAEGELVLTNFAQTFPLVRWRTSDLIQVVSTELCPCGRTHPRINILQRSDDLVNLGVIRFSTFTIKEALENISKPSKISSWQLRVGRKGYKPLLTVIIRPEGLVDEGELTESIQSALESIEALKAGWENSLICKPRILIDHNLGDRLSSSGKHRPLVYEEN